jgi:cytochrome P450
MIDHLIFQESLRKYSVVPIVARRSIADLHIPNEIDTLAPDYYIPKGSSILINIQAIHHDPNLWPLPMKYDPYRFLENRMDRVYNGNGYHPHHHGEKNDTRSRQNHIHDNSTRSEEEKKCVVSENVSQYQLSTSIDPYTYLPFIAGPRNCLGQNLALLESKIIVAMICQRYQFHIPANVSIHVNDWTRPHGSSTNNNNNNNSATNHVDPRHRFMIPVIPAQELMVCISRKEYNTTTTNNNNNERKTEKC